MSKAGQAMSANGISLTDFVLTELHIGFQFVALARDSYLRNLDFDGHRQMAAAIHAHQTAKDALPQVHSADKRRAMIEQRMVELGTAISNLEESSARRPTNRSSQP